MPRGRKSRTVAPDSREVGFAALLAELESVRVEPINTDGTGWLP